jgi:hypothetical protein
MSEHSRRQEVWRNDDSGRSNETKSFSGRDGFNFTFKGMNYEERREPIKFGKNDDKKGNDELKNGKGIN